MYAIDEAIMYGTSIDIWALLAGSYRGDTADIFSKYGPLQSILALPWIGLGRVLSWLVVVEFREFVVQWVVTWQSVVVVATTAVLLRWMSIRMGYATAAANILMFVYAFGSMATVYSRTFFSDTTVALWVLIGAIPLIVRSPYSQRMRWGLMFCGVSLVCVVVTKIAVTPAAVIWGIAILWVIVRDQDWQKFCYWGIGAGVSGICYILFNYVLYGSVLGRVAVEGYGGNGLSSDPAVLWQGMYGLYISWQKSIFVYTPFTLLWPVALYWKRLLPQLFWPSQAIILVISLIHAALLDKNGPMWYGGGSWGPRYLLIVLPLMLLSTAPVWHTLLTRPWPYTRQLIGVLSVFTGFVLIGAMTISLNTFVLARKSLPNYNASWYNAVIGHWDILRNQVYTDWQARHIPNVTLEGWSYSEGDLDAQQSFPRWLGERAAIHVQTATDAQPWMVLRVWQCVGASPSARWVDIIYQQQTLGRVSGCPVRIVRLMLAGGQSTVVLETTGAPPVPTDAYQSGWISTYGALVEDFRAYDRVAVIPVRTRPFAEERVPQGDFRLWLGDIRRGTYDFWWYYLWVLPPAHASMLWLVIAVLALWSVLIDWSVVLNWVRRKRWLRQL
jgi:hypothetical protein